MKKIIALACMITCIFGFTACGSEESYTDYEQEKLAYAEQLVSSQIVPILQNFMNDEAATIFDENTPEEVAYVMAQEYALNVEGNAFLGAIESFHSAAETVGEIVSIGEATAKIDDDTIIVTVPVAGSIKNAEAEVIVSNDIFLVLQSAALNEEASLGDAMVRAALNTLIGMFTVFAVLIIIICVISLFAFIPKIQAIFSKKEEKKAEAPKAASAPAPVAAQSVDVSNDCELVAVIAAAIAASEGQTSTDGFVVRSIRKVNRRK